MDINMRARVITTDGHPNQKELMAAPVNIVRAITEPGPDVDLETLPLFRCLDARGKSHLMFPEELRSMDGTHDPDQAQKPVILIGGKAVTDIHPFVVKTLREFFHNS